MADTLRNLIFQLSVAQANAMMLKASFEKAAQAQAEAAEALEQFLASHDLVEKEEDDDSTNGGH